MCGFAHANPKGQPNSCQRLNSRLRFHYQPLLARSVHENHPVLLSLDAELSSLRSAYENHPNEQTRYQVARLESLIEQWAPQRSKAA